MVRIVLIVFLFSQLDLSAQTFESHRLTAWNNAGLTMGLQAPDNMVDIMDFGADNTGANSCNSAYTAALASLNGEAGTVYFPDGEYFFSSTMSIPDSVFLKGESTETELQFDLGGSGHLIQMNGSIASTQYPFALSGIKGTHGIELTDASGLSEGDIVRLFQFDEDLMFSTWAYGTLGQVLEIVDIDANTVTFSDPLNHHYPLSRSPYLKKLNPRRAAGIECLRIEREDATTGQTSNIYMNAAFNCVVRNVESENCNFGHLEMNSSAHNQIEGCYFHHAFAYGGGGQGYGVVCQVASSFNLIQNNIFEHLRHSMLIQSGANGNVFGYNYSFDPNWVSAPLPANSAGDAVLHGNYVYMNLFEGNTVQHIVVDASHGSNGPFNTFFRNRAELYGFFTDSGTMTDSLNVVGNEITGSPWPYGMYSLNGAGHYSYGNNVGGTVNPSGTSSITMNTLYLEEQQLPDFLGTNVLPMVGYPLAMNEKLLPAEQRFDSEQYVACSAEVVTSIETGAEVKVGISLDGVLNTDLQLPIRIDYFSLDGRLIHSENVTSLPHSIQTARSIQVLRLLGASGEIKTIKASALLR